MWVCKSIPVSMNIDKSRQDVTCHSENNETYRYQYPLTTRRNDKENGEKR
jgi:hypothetical protein